MKQKVCVVGLGYIGLPTACLLAHKGYSVIGVDINPQTLRKVNAGEMPIIEPELQDLLTTVVQNGSLRAQETPAPADVFIIAVPTPFKGDHVPDISYVIAATRSVAPHLKKGDLVILESTSPVGTTLEIESLIRQARPDLFGSEPGVLFAYGPERVLPGKILKELQENDRVVGGTSPTAGEKTAAFYRTLTRGEVFVTESRTAEMTKLTENAFRDVNIAFANELSMICEKIGVNVWELIKLANRHPRVKVLQPGPGVGGHCIAVDPWFIAHAAPEESKLIRQARHVNLSKTHFVANRILSELTQKQATSLAFLGLSYKADIDDIRESPAMEILEEVLKGSSCIVHVVEPNLDTLPTALQAHPRLRFDSLPGALKNCSVVAALVDHAEFKALPAHLLEGKVVIDTRGVWPSLSSVSSQAEGASHPMATL